MQPGYAVKPKPVYPLTHLFPPILPSKLAIHERIRPVHTFAAMATRNSRYFVTPVVLQADGSAAPQRRYHYLDVAPASGVPQKATMLLLHGFPDFHVSWSHILAPLSMSGFRLIVPDCLGCGLTSKPSFATRLDEYGVESMTEDLIALLDHAKAGQGALYGGETVDANGHGGKVVCVGHDWGAALAWALARRRADRLLGVASLAVPYTAPSSKVMDMKTLIKRLPNFGYQAFFADPKSTKIIEANVSLKVHLQRPSAHPSHFQLAQLERFLGFVFQAPGLFSNDTKDDPHAPIANTEWVLEGRLEKLLTSPKQPAPAGGKLLSDEELANRVRVFQSGGMEGPLNWYRKRAIDATSDASELAVVSVWINFLYADTHWPLALELTRTHQQRPSRDASVSVYPTGPGRCSASCHGQGHARPRSFVADRRRAQLRTLGSNRSTFHRRNGNTTLVRGRSRQASSSFSRCRRMDSKQDVIPRESHGENPCYKGYKFWCKRSPALAGKEIGFRWSIQNSWLLERTARP